MALECTGGGPTPRMGSLANPLVAGTSYSTRGKTCRVLIISRVTVLRFSSCLNGPGNIRCSPKVTVAAGLKEEITNNQQSSPLSLGWRFKWQLQRNTGARSAHIFHYSLAMYAYPGYGVHNKESSGTPC